MTTPSPSLPQRMGPIGFGTAPIGNMHRVLQDGEVAAVLRAAWNSGCRYFDTAPLYGHGLSELRLARALETMERREFVLSTKVGRVLEPCAPDQVNSDIYRATPHYCAFYDYSYDGVMRSFEASVKRLGGIKPDILLVHDLDATTHGPQHLHYRRQLMEHGGWDALRKLREAGDVEAIGVGTNEVEPCAHMLAQADPDLFLIAGRYTLLDQSALPLLDACASRGVGVIVGGPFNSGILATGATPGARYAYGPAPRWAIERTRRLEKVCARHRVPLSSAALQFARLHPAVVSVIPGGQSEAEVASNAAGMAHDLPPELWLDMISEQLIARRAPLIATIESC